MAGDLKNDLVLGKDGGTRIAVKHGGEVEMVQGSTTVLEITAAGVVKLAAGASLDVARASDPVGPSTAMATFMTAVAGYINGIAPGTVVVPPGAIGSVTSGNSNVKA